MRAGEELVGRYRLVELLGWGAMGEVWRATDPHLERDVAVKTMLANWAGEAQHAAMVRFRREGRAAARLNHPHIAAVHDVGEHAGQPFLVLELLPGPDLAGLLERHPGGLPVEQALEYGAQAAEGLAAAHEAGIVHRDVKPSNLVLDRHGKVKVCDFGIARLEGATAGLSATGRGFGTPHYMPPEQINGDPVTPAADVYSLGATLFHLLTGRVVFTGDNLMAIVGQHLHKPPPAASSLRPSLPATVDTFLAALLVKTPADRPRTSRVPHRLRDLTTRYGKASTLLDEAEHAADSITDPEAKAWALQGVAGAMAAVDPARSGALLDESAQTARTVTGRFGGAERALRGAAKTAAAVDHAQAERIARTITDPRSQAEALLEVAAVIAAVAPARARSLLAETEQIAGTLTDSGAQGALLGWAALVMVAVDLSEAERITRAITDTAMQAHTLGAIAETMAAEDPIEAERIARTITDPDEQAEALGRVAKTVAAVDLARSRALLAEAQQIARTITDPKTQVWVLAELAMAAADVDPARFRALLAEAGQIADAVGPHAKGVVARAVAALDPRQAEGIARSITDPHAQAFALRQMAGVMAPADPARAERLAHSIADLHLQAWALREVAAETAAVDRDEAQRIARSITDPHFQGWALREVAVQVAAVDPAQAEGIARTIADPAHKAVVLSAIARAILTT